MSMKRVAPLQSFAGIPLTILSDEGRVHDWHRELIVNEDKVPSSNITITQIDGFGPWTLEVRLLFACVADWQAFDAMRGLRSELRHLADISASTPFTDHRHMLGDDYVTHDEVLYKHLVDPARPLRGGRVLARVTFQREGE